MAGLHAELLNAWCRVDFIEKKINSFLDVGLLGGNKKLLWVNPDCGLKTREWSQVGATPVMPLG